MTKAQVPVITFDGVGGSGKGTVAQRVAKRLGWHYLDSGVLYRVLANAALSSATSTDDEVALVDLLDSLEITFSFDHNVLNIKVNGADVTHVLRTESVGSVASVVGAHPAVRTALLSKQRDFQQAPGLVTDGRDMGSVIFPEATLKFYLDASAEVRAKRRQLQLQEMGKDVNFASLLKDLHERDSRDKTRKTAPLVVPEGAICVLTDQLTADQVFNHVMETINKTVGTTA